MEPRRRKRDSRDDILRDGETMRVPMIMRDGIDEWKRDVMHRHFVDTTTQPTVDTINTHLPASVTDAFGGAAGLNRPGARYLVAGGRTVDHARLVTAAHMRAEAYQQYDERDANAWRGTAEVQDGPLTVQDAYRAYDEQDAEAWRKGK